MKFSFLSALVFLLFSDAINNKIRTNELEIFNAPTWVKQVKVEKVADRVQSKLEWRIRRVPLHWHVNETSFAKAQSLGANPAAVTVKSSKGGQIHMGPKVNSKNYQTILGHELVHIIFFQKYKSAIPKWLEEGFANFYSKTNPVDYKWLARQNQPADITKLGHPFKASTLPVSVHYKTSQAVVEMLAAKCDLAQLLRLSVERKLETYIKRTCGIEDINQAYKQWLADKA